MSLHRPPTRRHWVATALLALATQPAWAQEVKPVSLPEVVVHPKAILTKPGALREDVVQTESIDAKAIALSGATNLPELMANRPGVDVQVECSVCNSRNITLNNLPGRFTTLMVDGVPIFSSVSNAYGLDMIGLNGLERVDISRGAGTSLVAPESLAGTVNLVTKRPTANAVELDLALGSDGLRRQSLYAARAFAGGALALTATQQRQDSVDASGVGISQYTGFERGHLGAGLFLDDVGGFKLKARLDHLEETRMGGPLGTDYDGVRADRSGNPFDFSKGQNGSPDRDSWIDPSTGSLGAAYEDGRFGFAQIIDTRRDQLVATAQRNLDVGRLRLALGYAEHQQDSWYGGDADYFGKQQQYYLEGSLQTLLGATLLTTGVSYRYEDLHSRSYSPNTLPLPAPSIDADAYLYRTPGLFVQAYRTALDDRLEINASLRYDDNNVYGAITSPRMNVLWHHTDELASRLSAGTGYRMPTSFFELEHAVLQASRVDRSRAKAETSENLSYALNYSGDRFTGTLSLNHTRIHHLALFVADPADDTALLLQPAPSAYTVSNIDFLGTWQVSPRTALTLGAEAYQYDFNTADFQGSLFARPDYRLSLAMEHTQGPLNLNLKATLTGPQDLARFYNYADNQRYDLNGQPKSGTSPSFWQVDLHANYQFSKTVSGYLGINNLLDYKQADKDSFLWVDPTGAMDVTHIWGPNLGRAITVGVKLAY
jgi:outer membrane receptor for ferrienterochelin and colicins